MKPILSMASVAAVVTALAVAPVLSQAQSTGSNNRTGEYTSSQSSASKTHRKSQIRMRSGQRPAGWRANGEEQSASSSASTSSSMTDASAASTTHYPKVTIPPTLRPADFYSRDANGTGGGRMFPEQPDPMTNPVTPGQPYPDPYCAPRTGATATQPACPLPGSSAGASGSPSGSAGSRAPDR
ncbi:hypothetical protein [Asticcacaulis solisilvae]|uniref:hypothetical protein n=1 Tax=Asticcacaulis solisilvae TaxID=1217274 RepID=UPI003FD89B01